MKIIKSKDRKNPMFERYHRAFKRLKPVLARYGFSRTEHHWETDGYLSCFWKDSEPRKAVKHPPSIKGILELWQPMFESRHVSIDGLMIKGRLDQQGSEPFWNLEMTYYSFKDLHHDAGFLGPRASLSIHDILERDFPNLGVFSHQLCKADQSLYRPRPNDHSYFNDDVP